MGRVLCNPSSRLWDGAGAACLGGCRSPQQLDHGSSTVRVVAVSWGGELSLFVSSNSPPWLFP